MLSEILNSLNGRDDMFFKKQVKRFLEFET